MPALLASYGMINGCKYRSRSTEVAMQPVAPYCTSIEFGNFSEFSSIGRAINPPIL